jgi:ComF family protein
MDDIITSKAVLSTKFQFLVDSIRQDIYRRHCYLCDSTFSSPLRICEPCFWDLPWQQRFCLSCGLPLPANRMTPPLNARLCYPKPGYPKPGYPKPGYPERRYPDPVNPDTQLVHVAPALRCLNCLLEDFHFDRCITPFVYGFPIAEVIHQYKYQRKRYWRAFIGGLLKRYATTFREALYTDLSYPLPDFIVPVPISDKKLGERHFNQAEDIARSLAKSLSAPMELQAIRKNNESRTQAGLSFSERQFNSRHAFSAGKNIGRLHARSVLIVDDIITTGSTVNQVAGIIREAGATSIEVWGVARTPKKDEYNNQDNYS